MQALLTYGVKKIKRKAYGEGCMFFRRRSNANFHRTCK